MFYIITFLEILTLCIVHTKRNRELERFLQLKKKVKYIYSQKFFGGIGGDQKTELYEEFILLTMNITHDNANIAL